MLRLSPADGPVIVRRIPTALLLLTALSAAGARNSAAMTQNGPSAPATLPLTIAIDSKRLFQTIDNFGASGCWTMDPIGAQWSEENRNRLADLLFSRTKGIGLSLWRFNIGAGGAGTPGMWDPWRGVECFKSAADAPYDWSRQAGQQWFLRAARRRGVRQFLAFANSPPTWLTRNGKAWGDRGETATNLKAGAETDYARFLADVLAHFAKEGLPFQYIAPLNEPSWGWDGGDQEGCRYSNEEIARVITALHAELKARGLKTEIDAPESADLLFLLDDAHYRAWQHLPGDKAAYLNGNGMSGPGKYREYIRDLLGDPGLRKAVGGKISAHSYWTDQGTSRLRDLRREVRRNLDAVLPGARYWQTEYCVMEHHRDPGMETALRVARVIHYDLTAAGASAWQWWLAVSPADYKDGLIYTDYRANGQQNIIPSSTLWALGNYSRYIRPGARRIASEPAEDGHGLYVSAYRNARSRAPIVVLINDRPEDRTVQFTFDTPTATLQPFVTAEGRALAPQPPVPADHPLVIPAHSVVTVVAGMTR